MSVLVRGSDGVWQEPQSVPQRYDPTEGARVETSGYRHDGEAWAEVWTAEEQALIPALTDYEGTNGVASASETRTTYGIWHAWYAFDQLPNTSWMAYPTSNMQWVAYTFNAPVKVTGFSYWGKYNGDSSHDTSGYFQYKIQGDDTWYDFCGEIKIYGTQDKDLFINLGETIRNVIAVRYYGKPASDSAVTLCKLQVYGYR